LSWISKDHASLFCSNQLSLEKLQRISPAISKLTPLRLDSSLPLASSLMIKTKANIRKTEPYASQLTNSSLKTCKLKSTVAQLTAKNGKKIADLKNVIISN